MRKIYTTFSALLLACVSVSAGEAMPLQAKSANIGQKVSTMAVDASRKASLRKGERSASVRKAAPLKAEVMSAVAGPVEGEPVIDERPEGTSQLYSKSCIGYGYNWLYGRWVDQVESGISEIVTAPDGKTVYMFAPFSQYPTPGWVKGVKEGDTLTFQLPQIVQREDYYGTIYEDYALCLKMGTSEEDVQNQWYVVCDDQAFVLKEGEGGVLKSADPEMMIGYCAWMDGAWGWQACGDLDIALTPMADKVAEIPADAKFESWWSIDGINAVEFPVAFAGNKVYIKGLFSSMPDAAVEGTLEGSKVTIKSGQFLGAYWDNLTPAYLLAVKNEGTAGNPFYVIDGDLVFEYDARIRTLTSEDTYLISALKDEIMYYTVVEKPRIQYQEVGSAEVKALPAPEYVQYYPPESGYEAELQFALPQVDAEGHVIDTSKIYWNLIMDDEVFVFMTDEYLDLDEDMVNVPYGYESSDFFTDGNLEALIIYPQGYDNLGVRALYIDGDKTVESDIMWVPGFESAIKDITASKADVKSVRYYDLQGREVANPEAGLYIRQTTFADGRVSSIKVAKR